MNDGSFEAFGHRFSARIAPWKAELESLASEGVTYEEWLLEEEDGGPGLYRVRFRPTEIHRYVRGLVGWDEFLDGGFDAVSDRALAEEASKDARERHAREEVDDDGSACPADFLGEDVEALVCGGRLNRAEKIRPVGTFLQANAVLHEIATSLPVALRALAAQGKNDNFVVKSELDFQNFLYLILRSLFDDARREEWTPSMAGNAKRVDLAVPSAGLLIEAKFVRSPSHGRKIADELRIDIESYHSHPYCETIFALVWDAAGHLPDPIQIERELSAPRVKGTKGFEVVVRVVH